jgi:hypothetical protein
VVPQIVIVVPVFNEVANIVPLVTEIAETRLVPGDSIP